MSTHTPGPWTRMGRDIYGANHEFIANIQGPISSERITRSEADAQLIAAALELLEALKALVDNIEAVEYRDKANLRLGEAVPQFQRAKQAIAKAKGGAA